MANASFIRSPTVRIAFFSGLAAGPVLAVLWPLFVRLESGVWPHSPLALTLAMLTLGTLVGMAAAFTLLLPALSLVRLRPGTALLWQIAALAGGGVCVLTALFGLFSGVERIGTQWPLWGLLTIAGALCGWLGAFVATRSKALPA